MCSCSRLAGARRTAALVALSAILAFFSLDDVVAFHEKLGDVGADALDDRIRVRIVWVAIFLPLLGAAFLGLVALSRQASAPGRRALRLGLALLVLAIMLEASAVAYTRSDHPADDSVYATEVAIEEAVELAGWILIAAALAALLGERRQAAPRRSGIS